MKDANKKFDYKKEFKELYGPKEKPTIVEVPEMKFIMIDGEGNPNDKGGAYQTAVEVLYGLAYTIKMSKMGAYTPEGYLDYVVPPLEGLWWLKGEGEFDFSKLQNKSQYCWTAMIRQPDFVTDEVFEWAVSELKRKKPHLETAKARLESFTEGLCVQMMHIGPFDDEPKTIAIMDRYMKENNLRDAIEDVLPDGKIRRHHEIYMGDPRKVAPEKMKTILRHPITASLYKL